MMRNNLQFLIAATSISLLVTACSNENADSLQPQTGTIIDAKVANLGVKTPSTGLQLTNSEGEFQYRHDEQCEIYIADTKVAEAPCQSLITPKDMVINGEHCDDDFLFLGCRPHINLARLLQSLNTEANPDIITLPEFDDAGSQMMASVNFKQALQAFEDDANVQGLMAQHNNGSLTAAVDAVAHLHGPDGGLSANKQSFIDRELIERGRHFLTMKYDDGTIERLTMHFRRDNTVDLQEGHIENLTDNPLKGVTKASWIVRNGDLHLDNGARFQLRKRIDNNSYLGDYEKPFSSSSNPSVSFQKTSPSSNNTDDAFGPFSKLGDAIVYIAVAYDNANSYTVNNADFSDFVEWGQGETPAAKPYRYTVQLFENTAATTTSGRFTNLMAEAMGINEGMPYILYISDRGSLADLNLPPSDNCPNIEPVENTSDDTNLKIAVITIQDYVDLTACYVTYTSLAAKILSENCEEFAGDNAANYCNSDGTANDLFQSLIPTLAMTVDSYSSETLQFSPVSGLLTIYMEVFYDFVEVLYEGQTLIIGQYACIEPDDSVSSIGQCSTPDDAKAIYFAGSSQSVSDEAFRAAHRLAEICAIGRDDCPLSISSND